jgi:hypothetical protein
MDYRRLLPAHHDDPMQHYPVSRLTRPRRSQHDSKPPAMIAEMLKREVGIHSHETNQGAIMKRIVGIGVLVLLVAFSRATSADFPVAHSSDKEWLPAIAYNSTNHEYLVVWSEEVFNGVIRVNWMFGQRVGEDGTLLGSVFVIFNYGVNTAVAYNSSTNEYLVAFNPGGGFVGQRINNTGSLIGSPTELMTGMSDGRLAYNSISGQFLFVGAVLVESPAGSGYYNIQVSSCKIGADGQQVSSPLLVDERPHGYNPPEPAFAVAYAPIPTTETPNGRYLLAIGRGVVLEMLNSDGTPIDIVIDPNHPGQYYREIPFKTGTPSGAEFNVDVAYGDESSYSMTGPAFLVVWADQNNRFSAQSWSGIWGGFLDATKISYSTGDTVQEHALPISAIADHWAYDSHVESWRPKASYNPTSQKFFGAWRDTPGTSQYNDTKVNHIRGSDVYERVPASNTIISATSGTEDPTRPALAASTASENALVVWQDSRNFGSLSLDIYGSIQKVADPVIPPPPTTTQVVINTLDGGSGSLRQAILDANAHSGTDTITFNIPGSGPHSISPLTTLPALTGPVVIDGYTQPGCRANTSALKDPSNAILKIVLDGTLLTIAQINSGGIRMSGGNSLVRGLVINSFPGTALVLDSKGGNRIEGCYVGTDDGGTELRVNLGGLTIDNISDNVIDGTSPGARNIISGNREMGIQIVSSGATGNLVQGNYIGVGANGTALLNSGNVILVINDASFNAIGGTVPEAGNVIFGRSGGSTPQTSGNTSIAILGTATGNTIAGNLIGTNPAGDDTLGSSGLGIELAANGNCIGGTVQGARNVISGSRSTAIHIRGNDNVIQGNYIGTDAAGSRALGSTRGVVIDSGSTGNTIGGNVAGARNIVSGNNTPGVKILGDSNLVQGNFIGTDITGTKSIPNDFGIEIMGGGIRTSSEVCSLVTGMWYRGITAAAFCSRVPGVHSIG